MVRKLIDINIMILWGLLEIASTMMDSVNSIIQILIHLRIIINHILIQLNKIGPFLFSLQHHVNKNPYIRHFYFHNPFFLQFSINLVIHVQIKLIFSIYDLHENHSQLVYSIPRFIVLSIRYYFLMNLINLFHLIEKTKQLLRRIVVFVRLIIIMEIFKNIDLQMNTSIFMII